MASKKLSDMSMDEQLSALLDNELDATACERAVARVSDEPSLLHAWSRQAMLRAVLSGEDRCMPDGRFADRVMAELAADDEIKLQSKVVPFEQRRSVARLWAAGGLAMAASVAAVAIVVGMLPVQKPGQAAVMIAGETPAELRNVAASKSSEAQVQRELEEYWLEHQRLAGRHGFTAPRGYMRMATPGFTQVSYSGE